MAEFDNFEIINVSFYSRFISFFCSFIQDVGDNFFSQGILNWYMAATQELCTPTSGSIVHTETFPFPVRVRRYFLLQTAKKPLVVLPVDSDNHEPFAEAR